MILIGVDNANLFRGGSSFDATTLGFEAVGEPIKTIEPRYLVLKNKVGIYSIHSYSLNRAILNRTYSDGAQFGEGLPSTLLKAKDIRLQLLFSKPESFLSQIFGLVTAIPRGCLISSGEFLQVEPEKIKKKNQLISPTY